MKKTLGIALDGFALLFGLGMTGLVMMTVWLSVPSGSTIVYTNKANEMWPEVFLVPILLGLSMTRILPMFWRRMKELR